MFFSVLVYSRIPILLLCHSGKLSFKIVFLYDSEVSYFDAEDVPLIKPRLYKFDSIEEFISWYEDSWKENGEKIDILTDLSVLWINGIIDEKIIYELRG